MQPKARLVSLSKSVRGPVKRRFISLLEKPLEKVLALDYLNRAYGEYQSRMTASYPSRTEKDGPSRTEKDGPSRTEKAERHLDETRIDGIDIETPWVDDSPGIGSYGPAAVPPEEGPAAPSTSNFFVDALEQLKIHYRVSDEDRNRIPQEGPVVVLANHPYGGIDGLVLGAILSSVRSDIRVLSNYLLARIPDLAPWLIAVNPFGGREAARSNTAPLRACLRWLKQGGLLCSFPSGTVSHLQVRDRCVADPEWNDHCAALIRKSSAQALPVYFSGRNSNFFQIMGLLHPMLRTVLLPRELKRSAHATVEVRIGRPVPFARLEGFATSREMTDYLRAKTYLLMSRNAALPNGTTKRSGLIKKSGFGKFRGRGGNLPDLAPTVPVAPAVDPRVLEEEIDGLPEDRLLVTKSGYSVHIVRAHEIPHTLEEIGRLREKTFREVGEGDGPGGRPGPLRSSLSAPLPMGSQSARRGRSLSTGAHRFPAGPKRQAGALHEHPL